MFYLLWILHRIVNACLIFAELKNNFSVHLVDLYALSRQKKGGTITIRHIFIQILCKTLSHQHARIYVCMHVHEPLFLPLPLALPFNIYSLRPGSNLHVNKGRII